MTAQVWRCREGQELVGLIACVMANTGRPARECIRMIIGKNDAMVGAIFTLFLALRDDECRLLDQARRYAVPHPFSKMFSVVVDGNTIFDQMKFLEEKGLLHAAEEIVFFYGVPPKYRSFAEWETSLELMIENPWLIEAHKIFDYFALLVQFGMSPETILCGVRKGIATSKYKYPLQVLETMFYDTIRNRQKSSPLKRKRWSRT